MVEPIENQEEDDVLLEGMFEPQQWDIDEELSENEAFRLYREEE